MRISRGRENVASEKRGPTVTGRAWADTLLNPQDDGVVVSLVFFEPGARTYWHHHEVCQVLHVTTGAGWIQTRDGQGAPLTVGDTVHIPAGEEHWHGGRDDSFMSHVAVSIGEVVWLEPVSDADYSAAIAG
jgi:quercetin dioxygenase-like cupin family protein